MSLSLHLGGKDETGSCGLGAARASQTSVRPRAGLMSRHRVAPGTVQGAPPARPSYLASAGSSGPLEQVSCRRKTASQKQVCRFPRPFSPRTLSIQRVETHRPIKDPSPTRTARSSKRHSPGPARDPAKASDASPLPPDIIGVSQRANQTRWGPGPPPVHDDARDLGLICQT